MSREEDHSIELEQNLLDPRLKIKMQTTKPLDTSNPSGYCWHCGESTGIERRWCDKNCCSDWGIEND